MQLKWTIAAALAAIVFSSPAFAQQKTPDSLPGCQYNATPPTLASGQTVPWQCDVNGKLITSGGSSGGSPGGATGTIQYNAGSGAFGGITDWSTSGTSDLTGAAGSTLAVGGGVIAGTFTTAITGDVLIVPNSVGAVVNANAASAPAPAHPGGIELNGADGAFAAYYAYSYGTSPYDGSFRSLFEGYSANGTGASPTATNAGDEMVRFAARGYGATGWTATVGSMSMIAAQTFNDTEQGTFTAFRTTPLNAVSGASKEWPPVVGAFAPSGALLVGGLQVQASFTGSTSAGHVLTVTSAVTGTIVAGQTLVSPSFPRAVLVLSGSGTTWQLSDGPTSVTNQPMTTGVPFALQTANDLGAGYVEAQTALALFGSTSGYTTLVATATASGTLTVPAVTDTLAVLGTNQTFSGTQTFSAVVGSGRTVSGTTDTLASTDCGTEVIYTSSSAVTVTVPATLPAFCNVAILQAGSAKVSVNGSAVTPATLHNAHSYTGTSAQWAIIGINVESNSGGSSAVAVLTGDGA